MTIVIVTTLALAGAIFSLASGLCVLMHLKDPKDAKLFGRVPWWLVGLLGYGLIAATTGYPAVTNVLAVVVVPVTAWLVYKAYKIRLGCPICPMIWVLNLALVAAVFCGVWGLSVR